MMRKALERLFNGWDRWRGRRWFLCRGCGVMLPTQQRRLLFLSVTHDLAQRLGRPERVGKIEAIPLCPSCYARERLLRQVPDTP